MRSACARLRAFSVAATLALCAGGLSAPAAADEGPTGAAPPRATPAARSYPRSFGTYDGLVEYASGVAGEQRALNDRLAHLAVRGDQTQKTIDAVFMPQTRDEADADLIDNPRTARLRSSLAADAALRQELLSSGAATRVEGLWRLPLDGEMT